MRAFGRDEARLALYLCDIGVMSFAPNDTGPFSVNLRSPDHPKGGPVSAALADRIADLLVRIIVEKQLPFKHLVGIPRAGEAFAEGCAKHLARQLDRPVSLLHLGSEAGLTGRRVTRICSGHFDPGERALLVDGMLSRGRSTAESISRLRGQGLKVHDLVVLIDAEKGGTEMLADRTNCRTHALWLMRDLLDFYLGRDRINSAVHRACADFIDRVHARIA